MDRSNISPGQVWSVATRIQMDWVYMSPGDKLLIVCTGLWCDTCVCILSNGVLLEHRSKEFIQRHFVLLGDV